MTMNFTEICKFFATHGNDRHAIANALHTTPEQIDEWQREAERIAQAMAETEKQNDG